MNRVAIFAHYDKDNLIYDHVVYYLKELKKVVDKIIFVSDSDLNETELEKIHDCVACSIVGRHGEYDFGSYKKGYLYVLENNLLNDADEFILVNDSCFGPLVPFENVFKEMENKTCDFWCMNSNNVDVKIHAQSFFLVFKSNVFKTKLFDDFMKSITELDNKDEIIEKYEIGLSDLLLANGFNMASYIESPIPREINGDIVWGKTINPLLKTCAVKGVYTSILKIVFKMFFERCQIIYPYKYIEDYAKQYNKSLKKNIRLLKKLFIRIQLRRRRIAILGHWFEF